MKKVLIFTSLVFLSACTPSENPDQEFDQFYQGSPQDFSVENQEKQAELQEKTTNSDSFTIKGESDEYVCETICTKK